MIDSEGQSASDAWSPTGQATAKKVLGTTRCAEATSGGGRNEPCRPAAQDHDELHLGAARVAADSAAECEQRAVG